VDYYTREIERKETDLEKKEELIKRRKREYRS